jgi:hypothetical protein
MRNIFSTLSWTEMGQAAMQMWVRNACTIPSNPHQQLPGRALA